MEAAVYGGIDEIPADCGGNLACATCCVVIAEEWRGRLGAAGEDEIALLETLPDPKPGSRLSCQIFVDDSLAGLLVAAP